MGGRVFDMRGRYRGSLECVRRMFERALRIFGRWARNPIPRRRICRVGRLSRSLGEHARSLPRVRRSLVAHCRSLGVEFDRSVTRDERSTMFLPACRLLRPPAEFVRVHPQDTRALPKGLRPLVDSGRSLPVANRSLGNADYCGRERYARSPIFTTPVASCGAARRSDTHPGGKF